MGEILWATIAGILIGVVIILVNLDTSIQKQCDTIGRLELNSIAYSCIKMPKPPTGE